MEEDREVHAILKKREIDTRIKSVEKRTKEMRQETKVKYENLTEKRGKHLSDHKRNEYLKFD